MYYVFSHYPCNDGELSRMVWEYFCQNSEHYNWQHTDHENEINLINNLPDNSNIVFLDVTPPINKLKNKHNYTIIDHHLNALLTLMFSDEFKTYNIKLHIQEDFPKHNNLSGCMLTWDYFTNMKYPSIIYHIGNKDVWNFNDINTEPYCIGYDKIINKLSYDEKKKLIFSLFKSNYMDTELINVGNQEIMNYKNRAQSYFENINFSTDNIDDTIFNIIDIICEDNIMYKYLIEYAELHYPTFDILRILCINTPTIKKYSLRSIQPHVKVDGLARKYGGNGHERASGYSINIF